MFVTLIEIFGEYYGLDWLSVAFGLYGLHLITEHRRIGFIFTILSVTVASVIAVVAHQYGFIVANVITAYISIRGYRKWKDKRIR